MSASSTPDLAHTASLIEDILTGVRATPADRRAIADHITGRRQLEAAGAPPQDSWTLTTSLAQAWQAYSQRANLSAGVLLRVLEGVCGIVTQHLDTETAITILRDAREEATPEQVEDLVRWLEREDIWDPAATAAQVRAAWIAYRDQHLGRSATA